MWKHFYLFIFLLLFVVTKTCLLFTGKHAHTHVGFYGLRRGLSTGVMVFILYKLYVLLPYT